MRLPVLIIAFSATTTTTTTPATAHLRHHGGEREPLEEAHEEEVAVVSLKVPPYVPRGQDAELECHWRVPRLYSLKWYFNGQELFGLRPGEAPSRVLHRLPGLRVDSARSTGSRLVLVGVGVSAGGRYKCEVIGEAPGFLTADRSAYMAVVHIPKEPPTIQGAQSLYRVGQKVQLACLSPPSRPPATLTWYINDRQAADEYVAGRNTTTIWGDGLLESRAGLQLILQPHHFDHHGQLRLRCSASIPGLYHKVRQHSIGGGQPLLVAPRVLPPSSSSSASSSDSSGGGVPVMESRDSAAAPASGGSGLSKSVPSAVVLLLALLTPLLRPPPS
ncbi:uncharacterized protein LOC123501824 [Portunus trituberculatus]|uniref:uncharacterized protein LOC123501824 n=1 Tax=Portunus trituberculatus TaxID=210409 RepID=UPI001E1CDCFE|nr:uncharacterized protein LOC123501824 [Portunus trituberculatus]